MSILQRTAERSNVCLRCLKQAQKTLPRASTSRRALSVSAPRWKDPPVTGEFGREINKSASSTNPQLQARPDNAFFEDVMAGGPRPPVQVDSVLRNGRGFQLSTGMEVSSAVLVLNGEALLWRPNSNVDKKGVLTLDLASFGIFDVSSGKPDMLIIGTGTRNEFVDKSVRTHLHSLGIAVDTMDTRNAASTFNVLAAEGRSVAAALLPA